jgi:hypothetical protein
MAAPTEIRCALHGAVYSYLIEQGWECIQVCCFDEARLRRKEIVMSTYDRLCAWMEMPRWLVSGHLGLVGFVIGCAAIIALTGGPA